MLVALFHQRIVDGRQVELPDKWLALPNPWEIERPEYRLKIHFGGRVERPAGGDARQKSVWAGGITPATHLCNKAP